MLLQIDEADDFAQEWLRETSVHRVFSRGWRAVQSACLMGWQNDVAGRLIPPIWSEMRTDGTGVLLKDSIALYRSRVRRTILTNFYTLTASFLTGQVFKGVGKLILPPELEYLNTDADGKGTPAVQFFSRQFYDALLSGVRGCIVTTNKPGNAVGSLAVDDQVAGHRTLLVDVAGESILGGRGDEARIATIIRRPEVGGWGTEEVKVIHVVSRGGIKVYEKNESQSEYALVDTIPYPAGVTATDFFIAGEKIGDFHGIPPLDGLSGIQLQHLHVTSEDAQARAMCNTIIPHTHGFAVNTSLSNSAVALHSGQSRINAITGEEEWVEYEGQHAPYVKIAEPTGAVLKGNSDKLNSIMDNAALWGLSMLKPQGITVTTATAFEIITDSSLSALTSWAAAMDQYIQHRIETAARLHNVTLEGPVVDLEKDYSKVDFAQLASYLRANELGILSNRTIYETLQQEGGIVTQKRTWEEEQEMISEERVAQDQDRDLSGPAGLPSFAELMGRNEEQGEDKKVNV